MKRKGRKTVIPAAAIVFVSISLVAGWSWHSLPSYTFEPGNHIAEKAFYEQRTGIVVEVTGKITRILGDNETDSDYQWFEIKTPNGQRILVGHNNGVSDPIPFSVLDEVTVRGEYAWTEKGGTIRGTQRDNSLNRRHGWIALNDKRYD